MEQVIRDVATAYELLKREAVISIDIETDGLDPFSDNVLVVSMCGKNSRQPVVLHLCHPEMADSASEMLFDLCNDGAYGGKEWITHNGTTFDLLMLAWNAFGTFKLHYDTLIGEQVLSTQGRRDIRKNLASTMKRRIGKSHKGEIEHESWRNPVLSAEQVEYCANDVLWLHAIRQAQERLARERGLSEALASEQMLTTIIAGITLNGMRLDKPTLKREQERIRADADSARMRLDAEFGSRFNVNSSKQVKAAINSMGYDIADTAKATLLALERCPQAQDIITVREADKRSGFYSEAWVDKYVHKSDSRVRPRYWQVGTDTTRFSCSDPNMQQVPRDLRCIIGNEPDFKVVQGDWSQLEVRIAAHYAKDPDLIRETVDGDIHSEVAGLMFPDTPIDADMRRYGKAGTFTWLFGGRRAGIQSGAMQSGVALADKTADEILEFLDARFPQTQAFHRRARHLVGQRRQVIPVYLPWGHHRQLVGRAMQTPPRLLNTLVQGTAAVGFKETLFLAEKRGLLDYVGGLVHDEIVATSVPESEAESYRIELEQAMVDGMQSVVETVPIAVDAEINDAWVP